MAHSRKCEYCLNFEYDEEYGCEICTVDLDMDEAESLSQGSFTSCPYFRINNEYKIVEKQN